MIDKSQRGLWKLTEKGKNIQMTPQLASDIFYKWSKLLRERKQATGENGDSPDEGCIPSPQDIPPQAKKPAAYLPEDFLKDVFISPEKHDTIRRLLMRKKNIILQGSPGVGKTFAARRLAYSLLGSKDESHICFVQFHQNYAYEDFIMGYRPDGGGFSLKEGIFYQFCAAASERPEEKYFFIIDEINRGNLSKILGELLMLIESDKRGRKHAAKLAYTGDPFYVPENLYIIGMMNTADRSLAIIDYALRRRFCFVDLAPAFTSEAFKAYLGEHGVPDKLSDKIIRKFIALNEEIGSDLSLGNGFLIGHSYLCDCGDADDVWYETIIRYEIWPILQEYWFDNSDKAEEWTEELLRD